MAFDYYNQLLHFYGTSGNVYSFYFTDTDLINNDMHDVVVFFDCTTTIVSMYVNSNYYIYFTGTSAFSCSNTPYYVGVGAGMQLIDLVLKSSHWRVMAIPIR